MALASNEDIRLRISAETIGTSGAAALAAQIEAIAKQAGDAGPRFTQLAAELRKLDAQQVSINGLTAAIESAKTARAAFAAAREQVAVLDKALADAKGAGANRQATALLEAELRKANQALAASEAGWNKQRAALAASRAAAQAAGVDTRNLGAAQQQLNSSLEATRNALAAQVAAVNAARAAAASRAAELRAQAAEEDRLNAIVLANKKKLEAAAQQQLAAEKRAFAERAAAAQRFAEQTAAINRAIAASVNNAFATSGVRSSQQINAEIARINQALGTLSRSAGTSGADFDRAFAAAQRRIAELKRELGGTVDAANRIPGALKPVAAALAGMFAVGQVKSYAGDLIRIADEFKNLNARLNITNSSVAGFNVNLDQIAAIATRSTSALGDTVQLFTALSRAGAELGSSQADIERLTETINKANQVAGQSAGAASAAIVQLIQGLQSGVVRGQEFNSIMEQSPRLARALADGLGVTLGALRKLANEGKLTSDVVMTALQSQAKVIDEEYSKLPTTVSNALTNLSTQWTQFVGELDSSAGATDALVAGIGALAENLSTVAEAAAFAGETIIAAFAIKGLAALKAYIAGLAAATGATGALATATTAAGAAAARLGPILRAVGWAAIAHQVFEIASNYKKLQVQLEVLAEAEKDAAASKQKVIDKLAEVSRATGVTVTSMAELDRAVDEQRIHFDEATASWKAGADSSVSAITRLGRATFELVEQFDKASTKQEALAKLVSTFDASSVVHVQNFARALQELEATGKLGADEVKAAWATALDTLDGAALVKFANGWEVLSYVGQGAAEGLTEALGGVADRLEKLNGAQLTQFQQSLASLFEAGKLSAKEFADLNDQVLSASFARLGVNAAQAMGTISTGAADAVATFDAVDQALQKTSTSAAQVATALELAFGQSIAKADSLEAIAQLETRLKALAESGKIGAEGIARMTAELDKQRGTIEDQLPGIQSLEEAYRNLGLKSQAELKRLADVAKQSFEFIKNSGKAAPKDIEASFKAYATAAIEANDGVADATIKSQARMLGLKVEADETGKTVVRTMEESAAAAKKLADATKDATEGVAEVGEAASAASASLVDIAKAHNAAVGPIEGTWLKGAAAASKYANEAREAAWATNKSVAELTASFQAYVSNMEALDRRQNALNSSGARGVEDLKLRLLELNGTEEQIAKARLERDKAEVRRQAAMLEIEARRAQVRGEGGEAKRLREEIKLLEEQLVLIDKVFKAEQRNAKSKSGGGGGGSSGGLSAGGSGNAPTGPTHPSTTTVTNNPVFNIVGVTDPAKLAPLIDKELRKLNGLRN